MQKEKKSVFVVPAGKMIVSLRHSIIHIKLSSFPVGKKMVGKFARNAWSSFVY